MSSANRRAALGALDRVRPVVSGLTRNRPNEELATDLGHAWELTEVALRALLGGTTVAGQALVREVRQRELITIEQAHALVNFHAAKDRAELPGYQVGAGDVSAARDAVSALDHALGGTVVGAPALETAPLPPPRAAAPAAAGAAGADWSAPPAAATRTRGIPSGAIIGLVALLVVALALGAWWALTQRGPSLEDARQLYAQGQREQARLAFSSIAQDDTSLAEPHVFLGRIAREQGELATAQSELSRAIQLEPRNATALREMGSLMLATNNPELARRFYVRALEINAGDRVAQGYLGCALMRLGRPEGVRFLDRAGAGDWSACRTQAPAPGAPAGALPPPGYQPAPR